MRLSSRRLLRNALEEYMDESQGRPSKAKIGKHCYSCDPTRLPPELADCFVQLDRDDETNAFINDCVWTAHNVCLQLLYSFVNILLCLFLSRTDINGLLERGHMFVFSKLHLRKLISRAQFERDRTSSTLLDIGAGDGCVTQQFGEFATSVCVTEASVLMRRALQRKNFRVLDLDKWYGPSAPTYNLISILNVLDRCDKPRTLLSQAYGQLEIGGLLVIALVLPFAPFVEQGTRKTKPSERLEISSGSWEEGVTALWKNVVAPLGFQPVALTRLPYLSEGDLTKEYYMLDNAVLILKKL
ncbi:hypothetical protein EMCRGX_G030870 [Ephydatia muelleri]